MTLRLDPAIEEMVVAAAHDAGLTKSDWIRVAILQGLSGEPKAKMRGARQ
jgi:hypothetical protein